jgi:hypothetical protein
MALELICIIGLFDTHVTGSDGCGATGEKNHEQHHEKSAVPDPVAGYPIFMFAGQR